MSDKTSAVRKIHFCYGHRVMNHESKCATCHGHNGVLWVYARPKTSLDELGRVVDFSVLKEKIGSWVDKYWDHNFLVNREDEIVYQALKVMPRKKEPFLCDFNPTAENMAEYLLKEICPDLMKDYDIEVHKIVLYETENCYVEVEL